MPNFKLIIAMSLLLACGKQEPTPETRYLGDLRELEGRFLQLCLGTTRYPRIKEERSLPKEHRYSYQFLCTLPVSDERQTGRVPITLRGIRDLNKSYACGIRIGPGPIVSPLPVELVLDMLPDRAVAASLRRVIGDLDLTREYDVHFTEGGVHVRLEQWREFGPQMEMVIDACSRLPDATREHTIGPLMRFPKDGE